MWDEKFEEILRTLLPFLPAAEPLDGSAELVDLGLDSMGKVELLAALEGHYGVRFVDDALNAASFASADVLWKTLSEMTGNPA
ncbi:phosphopantetheine-binding protein [Streptomyces sp. NPDC048484]|uniref:phosphopantetheine-binding protein n=1 Tax=Streptomyces sp. NPDC048484 TaxID=3155146 RepID=UPI0034354ABD